MAPAYKYSDIAIRGTKSLYNADAIMQSIRTSLFTVAGERIFRPEVGSRLETMLWRTMSEETANDIKVEVKRIIDFQGQRVTLRGVYVTPDYVNNSYQVDIEVEIDGVLSEDTILLKNKGAS